jgi:hypothetical protein
LDAFPPFAFALGAFRAADFREDFPPAEDFFLAAFFLAAGLEELLAAFFLAPPAAFPTPGRLVGADVGPDRVDGEDDAPPNVLVRGGDADPLPAPKPLLEPAED